MQGARGKLTTCVLQPEPATPSAHRSTRSDAFGQSRFISAMKSIETPSGRPNLGTKVFAGGFDSETGASANLGCWSASVSQAGLECRMARAAEPRVAASSRPSRPLEDPD